MSSPLFGSSKRTDRFEGFCDTGTGIALAWIWGFGLISGCVNRCDGSDEVEGVGCCLAYSDIRLTLYCSFELRETNSPIVVCPPNLRVNLGNKSHTWPLTYSIVVILDLVPAFPSNIEVFDHKCSLSEGFSQP